MRGCVRARQEVGLSKWGHKERVESGREGDKGRAVGARVCVLGKSLKEGEGKSIGDTLEGIDEWKRGHPGMSEQGDKGTSVDTIDGERLEVPRPIRGT